MIHFQKSKPTLLTLLLVKNKTVEPNTHLQILVKNLINWDSILQQLHNLMGNASNST